MPFTFLGYLKLINQSIKKKTRVSYIYIEAKRNQKQREKSSTDVSAY